MGEFRFLMTGDKLDVYSVAVSNYVVQRFFPEYARYLVEELGLSRESAQEKVRELKDRAESLSMLPNRFGTGRVEGTREFPIPGEGWVLVYRVLEDEKTVEVIAVVHELTLP